MAEDENLQLLPTTRPPQQPPQGEQIPDNEIHKRPEQATLPRPRQQSAEPSEPSAPREPQTSLRTLRAEEDAGSAGETMAAPSPWAKRAPTSSEPLWARPPIINPLRGSAQPRLDGTASARTQARMETATLPLSAELRHQLRQQID